ncbi:MAG: HAD family phosphatase [Clostridia bacterium]|nr:HAD family phosphatase [Clostridia bacterium]
MIKLLFFDLDGTLAPVGLPVPGRCVRALRKISRHGVRIAVCSGKPVAYLNGFARQLGIEDIILCGENGLTYQLGVGLPPSEYGALGIDSADIGALARVSAHFKAEFGDSCWYQPNEYAFTPFPHDVRDFPRMRAFLENALKGTRLALYDHPDCFDILPRGADKGKALLNICALLGIDVKETVAVGDHINDYPMFAVAGLSVGISLADKDRARVNVRTPGQALDYLQKEIIKNV